MVQCVYCSSAGSPTLQPVSEIRFEAGSSTDCEKLIRLFGVSIIMGSDSFSQNRGPKSWEGFYAAAGGIRQLCSCCLLGCLRQTLGKMSLKTLVLILMGNDGSNF